MDDNLSATLAYVLGCELRGRHPPVDQTMIDLEKRGFITMAHSGWGHYRVHVTQAGIRALNERKVVV